PGPVRKSVKLRANLNESSHVARAILINIGAAAIAHLHPGSDIAVAVLGQDRGVVGAELAYARFVEIAVLPALRLVAPTGLSARGDVTVAMLGVGGRVPPA